MNQSDADLLLQVNQGEAQAYALLYQRYKQKIYNYVRNLLNYDTDAANTVTSDVFIKLFDYCQHKKVENFQALAYKTGHNLAINWIQKYKKESYIKNDEQRDQFEDGNDEYEKSQIDKGFKNEALQQCLAHLTEEQREIIYLYYHEEKDYETIAKILGSNKNTIGTLLSRAKKKLKTIIEQQGMTNLFTL